MTESIFINDIEYNIEDEELDEVSYYEILSLKEIIKDNPTFIAFSREELINELNIIFKDFDKSSNIAELFFKDKNLSLQNIIFVTDANRSQRLCSNEEHTNFIEVFEKLKKLQPKITSKQKNKYLFAIQYDNESDRLRLKPHMKTMIRFKEDKNDSYLIFPDDDTNIPVFAAYFKQPVTTMYDFLTDKVLSHTKGTCDLYNYVYADTYTNIDKLVSAVKPKMKLIIEKNKFDDDDDYDFDTHHIDNLLRKFDTSFDEINKNDFELLREELEQHILNIKPVDIKYKGFRNKKIKYITEKLSFFDKLKNIKKMIEIPEKIKEENESLISLLEEQKFQLNASPLIYNNVKDIVNAVENDEVSIEDIIDNIDVNRQVIVFDHAITTLKHINSINATEVQEGVDNLIVQFSTLKEIKNDVFELHFLEFFKEIKELKEGNDYSEYEGVPDNYKNEAKFDEQVSLDMDIFMDSDIITSNTVSKMMLEKYWLSQKYKYAKGFVEMLQIVLPMIEKVREISSLEIDYEHLCQELYKHFSGIPTKHNILYNLFKKHNINDTDENIKNMSRIIPRIALTDILSSEYEQFKDVMIYIKECNQQFVQTLTDMMCISISWLSIRIQDNIIDGINVIQENLFQTAYADKWSTDGHPLKESDTNQGVTIYLSAITQDVITEEKDFFPLNIKDKDVLKDIKDITKKIISTIKANYQNELEELKINNKNISKKENKGNETYRALKDTLKQKDKDKILVNYINALMYMPGYKYKKINKFLLGCCLQKIGKTFTAFSDLKFKDRKDLIAVKNIYSKKRETIKTSKRMFCPVISSEKKEDASKKSKRYDEKYILPNIKMNDNDNDDMKNNSTVETWIESMHNVSPLLSEKIINVLKNNSIELRKYSDENVRIFCNTSIAKHQTKYIQNQLYINNGKYSSLLKRICTVLKTMNIDRTMEESTLLLSGIETINAIIQDIDKLNVIVDEYNTNDIQNIRYYILTRAICLPFNPDIAKENNDILYSSISTSETFVHQTVKAMYNAIKKYISSATMPTIEENLNFINKIREENKKKTLDNLNTKTNEERSLIDQLKKIGIQDTEENMTLSEEYMNSSSMNEINEMYNNDYQREEVENEFLLVSQEEDEIDF